MRNSGLLLCFILNIALIDIARASVCPGNDNSADVSSNALSTLSHEITVCELRNEFNANNSPKMYWMLHKGLSQPSNGAKFIEEALTFANQASSSRDLGRAEKIYQIVLARYPSEPRVLSSYSALHIYRQQYIKASTLLDKAMKVDPRDPLILNNAYLLAVLKSDYKKASSINRRQLLLEPKHYQHMMRRALLDRFFMNTGSKKSWQTFMKHIDNDNNREYWKSFDTTFQHQDMRELVHTANQWIDYQMPFDAVMLLDYTIGKKELPDAWYIKAKAFENKQHLKLAFDAANRARDILVKSNDYDKSFYKDLLYEVGRLAYAVRKYEYSLGLLDEYADKGYAHAHLQYIYAVNLDALGRHTEARPYFKKCAKQALPNNMLTFCKQRAKRKMQPAKVDSSPNELKHKSIKVGYENTTPLTFIRGTVGQKQVNWIGKVEKIEIEDLDNSVHIVWVAKYLQPEKPVEVRDGKEYKIKFKKNFPYQMFQINLYLNTTSDENRKEVKKQFQGDEKYILVSGKAYDVQPINKSLAAVVGMNYVIFTSKITEIY